jgi:cytochrome c-type biogenesis protein
VTPQDVTLPLAFLAGLASFLSPCVLALVPAYIGYLSSRSVTAEGVVVENRWETFGHGLAFVAGFSLVFIGLGAAA